MQDTSLEAYWNEIAPSLGTRQKEVLSVLSAGGSWSNNEIAEKLGKPINTITPRIFELRKAGLVEEAGKRLCGVTSRKVIAWRRVQKVEVRVPARLFSLTN